MKSIQDGSFAFKILNRLSPVKYVPGAEKEINEYLTKHYPKGEAWRSLSPVGRKTWMQFHPLFEHHEIQMIAYVGANEGATAIALNEAFPGREFLLFEPVPQTFDILIEKTKLLQNMHCLNIAAGSKEEERQMLIDEFSQASSLLPYEPIALEEYPFLGKQSTVKVHVRQLDLVMREKNITNVDLLLMDVQGFEDEVLFGAEETLKSCKVVISELSLQALYSGSSTFDSVHQELVRRGFQLRYLINPMRGESHQILQIDGIFVRVEHE
jgi:FkbM family methyltransferase